MATSKISKKRNNETNYDQIISMNDEKINVLILGTSGCGKSTLINSILGKEVAKTGNGEAVTDKIEVYQSEELPFRMIDTVGYEYGLFNQLKVKRDIAKFCKEGVKTKDLEKLIHMIWFCIDGTSKKITQEVLGYIKSVTKDWKNVPVIIVFTKSYSSKEVDENISMAKNAIEKYNSNHKNKELNVKDIIPVVAKTYQIDDTVYVPSTGLDTLIDRTEELLPEAKKIGNDSIREIDIKIKNSMANGIIGTASTISTTIGAVDITGIADATLLIPTQTVMLNRIASIYGIKDENSTNNIIDTIIQVGGTTIAGKALIKALRMVPGLNIAGAVLNAAVAGTVTFAAGEISNTIFQRIYKKELDPKSVDWEKEITKMFKDYLPEIIAVIEKLGIDTNGKFDIKKIGSVLEELSKTFLKKK